MMPTSLPKSQSRRAHAWAQLAPIGLLAVIMATLALGLQPGAASAAGPLSWSAPALIDPGQTLTAISCPFAPPLPEALCAAVDDAGNVLISTNPTGGASAWQKTNIDGTTPLTAVSCQWEACIAVDGLGNALVGSGTGGGPSSWTWTTTTIDPGNGGLTGVSCPPRDVGQVGFCLAVDHAGNAVLRTNGWKVEAIDAPGGHVSGLSCTEFSEWCIAWDDLGNVLTSGEPAEGASTWTVTSIDPAANLTGVSCPYISGTGYNSAHEYCLAADQAGNVLAAAKPAVGASAWTTRHIEAHGFTGVSCPFVLEAYFCAAVDDAGNAATSSNPLGGAADWSVTPIDPGISLTGVSCPYSENGPLCFAISANGEVIVGTGASEEPAPKEEPPHEVSPPTTGGGGTDNGKITDGGFSTVSTISSARLKALLASQLTPSGKVATIGSLLKHGGLSLSFTAPEAGRLVVQWYQVPSGAKLAKTTKAKLVLIASGKLTFSAAGTGRVKLTLTAQGKKLLKHVKRVRLEAKGTFVPVGGVGVSAVGRLLVRG